LAAADPTGETVTLRFLCAGEEEEGLVDLRGGVEGEEALSRVVSPVPSTSSSSDRWWVLLGVVCLAAEAFLDGAGDGDRLMGNRSSFCLRLAGLASFPSIIETS
jgi:hypothetical protein